MSRNQDIAAAFGAQFDPALVPVQTRRVNGVPHRDAWLVAAFDGDVQAGITAHVYGGGELHVYVEAQTQDAEAAGRWAAAALKALKDGRQQVGAGPQGQPEGGAPEGHAEQGVAVEAPPQG